MPTRIFHSIPLAAILGLAAILTVAWFAYAPGLGGPFLFDDFKNLERIGALGEVDNRELLSAYVFGGNAGPTGRPIALASFLIDARDWPADPFDFKRTNVLLHLLNGATLFLVIRLLLCSIGHDAREASWIALFSMALWVLNPFLVSTTLYAVQRMTQLSALFVLLGILGYLEGRRRLLTRPALGYTLITASVTIAAALAVLSKENGALLPLLLLVIEYALRFHWTTPGPERRWVWFFLGLPSLLILFYLLSRIPGAEASYAGRDFSLPERLLSQPRFLWDYLWHLFVPSVQTQGLYHDGRAISTGWLTPWTTLPAVLGLIGLAAAGFTARRRWPLASLAILFFLGGHLIESTILPLELYFEHRNYLPAAFLFLPVVAGLYQSRLLTKPMLMNTMWVVAVVGFGAATWQNARLWGDENRLMLVWAESNPASARAQVSASQTWLRLGRPDLALAHIENVRPALPESALLISYHLALKTALGRLDLMELREGAARLAERPFDGELRSGLEELVRIVNTQEPNPEHTEIVLSLLTDIRSREKARIGDVRPFTLYLQGKLYVGQGFGGLAYRDFSDALASYRRTEAGLNMVSLLASKGFFEEALTLLDQVRGILAEEPDQELRRKRSTYESEIERLGVTLAANLAAQDG